jgi:cell division protein FtsW
MLTQFRHWLAWFWQPKMFEEIDKSLVFAVCALVSIGILMVTSASIGYSAYGYGDEFFFLKRHLIYLAISVLAALVVLQIPMQLWYRYAGLLLVGSAVLLIAVLIPGIGHEVNGSSRWLSAGPLTLQVSELAKLAMIIFIAAYLQRHHLHLRDQWQDFIKPLGILALFSLLLLLEPDFGSTMVIGGTVLAMLFLAGVRLWQFLALMLLAVFGVAGLIFASPYRFQRLVTFLDPWADRYDSGYQLTQSLIAFGRGEWFGVGLGNSVQKLFYLPEAHTDFVFAIFAEEFGLLGVLVVLGLLILLVARVFAIGLHAIKRQDWFVAYAVFGFGIMLAGQSFINLGVTSGLLPTKGLTLPFLSYGGSSLLVCSLIVALVLRAGLETNDTVPMKMVKAVQDGRSENGQ